MPITPALLALYAAYPFCPSVAATEAYIDATEAYIKAAEAYIEATEAYKRQPLHVSSGLPEAGAGVPH